MSRLYLSVSNLHRQLSAGQSESLAFGDGVNLLVGRPNTGKTKWLQTLDFLLGDTGENPYEASGQPDLASKYSSASASLLIGEEKIHVERRWMVSGAKSKIYVEGSAVPAREFQQWLMDKLSIPLLHFPKGNPMSGQTWPELSFRMILRHIYRQQRFWGGIADQQPEAEQHAALLLFLGIAENVYSAEYGKLISLRMQVTKLEARREQFHQTIAEFAKGLLDNDQIVSVTTEAVNEAVDSLITKIDDFHRDRNEVLARDSKRALSPEALGQAAHLGKERARVLIDLAELRHKLEATTKRTEEISRYQCELENEVGRLARATDAGMVLSDLQVTHCPACDQTVNREPLHSGECFLCHQQLPDEILMKELGVARLLFEGDRLSGELEESKDLLLVLSDEGANIRQRIATLEIYLHQIQQQLAPARHAVAALAQEDVSEIDVAIGQMNERISQLRRVAAALEIGNTLIKQIEDLEEQIEPLQRTVDNMLNDIDFEEKASFLEDGMNSYLRALNKYRRDVWRHTDVNIDLSKSSISFRVGRRRWSSVLGGTDTLYFLMAYHYGLLTLSSQKGCHYPGLSIIDLPGEFLGEEIEDKENFIVQPFIDLLREDKYKGAQLVMTGASFSGLEGANIQHLNQVHVAQ